MLFGEVYLFLICIIVIFHLQFIHVVVIDFVIVLFLGLEIGLVNKDKRLSLVSLLID